MKQVNLWPIFAQAFELVEIYRVNGDGDDVRVTSWSGNLMIAHRALLFGAGIYLAAQECPTL
jgi:hypothetical protein